MFEFALVEASGGARQHAKPIRHPDQVCERIGPHPAHSLTTMDLHRDPAARDPARCNVMTLAPITRIRGCTEGDPVAQPGEEVERAHLPALQHEFKPIAASVVGIRADQRDARR